MSLEEQKGTSVNVNEEFATSVRPTLSDQTCGELEIYRTSRCEAKYFDEDGEMKLVGKLAIDTDRGLNRFTTLN